MDNKWSVDARMFVDLDHEIVIDIVSAHDSLVGMKVRLPFHGHRYAINTYNIIFVREWFKLLKERAEELCRIMNNEEKRREIKGIDYGNVNYDE